MSKADKLLVALGAVVSAGSLCLPCSYSAYAANTVGANVIVKDYIALEKYTQANADPAQALAANIDFGSITNGGNITERRAAVKVTYNTSSYHLLLGPTPGSSPVYTAALQGAATGTSIATKDGTPSKSDPHWAVKAVNSSATTNAYSTYKAVPGSATTVLAHNGYITSSDAQNGGEQTTFVFGIAAAGNQAADTYSTSLTVTASSGLGS